MPNIFIKFSPFLPENNDSRLMPMMVCSSAPNPNPREQQKLIRRWLQGMLLLLE